MELRNQGQSRPAGYAMAALLVALGVMAVMLTVAMPTWRQFVQREKEEELIFRGQQYVRAIGLFQRKYAAAFPPDVDTLVNQRFLRKKYKDPITAGDFQVLYQMSQLQAPGQGGRGAPSSQGPPGGRGFGTRSSSSGAGGDAGSGRSAFGFSSGTGTSGFGSGTLGARGGMVGVASKSTDASIRLYNGRSHYNEWQFIYAPTLMGPGMGRPGMMPGRGGVGPGRGGLGGPGGFGGRGMGPGGFGPGGRGMRPGGQQIEIGPDGIPRGPDGQPIQPPRRGGRGGQ